MHPLAISGVVLKPTLPQVTSKTDIDSYDAITSVPTLLQCIQPTGHIWGRRVADVKISLLPKNLVAAAFLLPSSSDLRIVLRRWDRQEYLGWEEDFSMLLTFSSGDSVEVIVPSSSRLIDGHSFVIDCRVAKIRERQPQENRLIPRVLWNITTQGIDKVSSHAVRRLLRNVRFINSFIQCTSLYLVVEKEACDREVTESGIPNFSEAYASIIPGSYKADLLRYYLLYKYGGVYADDKCTLRHSLDSDAFDAILGDGTTMFIGVIGWGGGVPEIAFMGSRAGCLIMRKALETSIDNIMNRRYGEDRLAITGSTMLKRVMEEGVESDLRESLMTEPPESSSSVGMRRVRCWGEDLALLRTDNHYEKIFYGKELLWHRQAIPFNDWPKSNSYYWNLWNSREVYVDGNPPAPLGNRISRFLTRTGLSTVIGILFGILILTGVAIAIG